MPNHCENKLIVSGRKTEVMAFKEKAEGYYPWRHRDDDITKQLLEEKELLSCNSFIPAPKKAIADYDKVGYDFCCNEWGTKWGCYEIERIINVRSLIYYFMSAWSPPEPVILEMSRQFPGLKFVLKYWEAGAGFKGELKCKGGQILVNKSDNYKGRKGG